MLAVDRRRTSAVGGGQSTTEIHENYDDASSRIDSGINGENGSCSNSSSQCVSLRRQLRAAVRDGNIEGLRLLLQEGLRNGNKASDVINESVSDVFSYSVLTLAVRCGHLDVVEALTSAPQCDVNRRGGSGLSALDEALVVWFRGATKISEQSVPLNDGPSTVHSSRPVDATARERHLNAKRYRIVRHLLENGARSVSFEVLDRLMTTAMESVAGRTVIRNLAKVVCEKGCSRLRSAILSILVWYPGNTDLLVLLLSCSADPTLIASITARGVASATAQRMLPFENAALLVRSSNDQRLLNFIDWKTSALAASSAVIASNNINDNTSQSFSRRNASRSSSSWPEYRLLIVLLTLSGHKIQLSVLDWLFRNHAIVYRWVIEHGGGGSVLRRTPASLLHSARMVVRCHVRPNVLAALSGFAESLPTPLRNALLFSEVTLPA